MDTARQDRTEEVVPGIQVEDPYRWLEDSSSASVAEWTAEQDDAARKILGDSEARGFESELERCLRAANFSEPLPVSGRYFFTERGPGEEQKILYWKEGFDAEAVELVNPNGSRPGSTTSIDFWSPSRDGKLVAYGLSEGGTEMATLRVRRVESGEDLPDEIPRCRYSQVRWLPDSSGFFYTRQPREGEVPENESHLHTKVYRHTLGDSPSEDLLIFGAGRPKDDMIQIALSADGTRLGISVSRSWTENDLYVFDTQTGETHPLAVGLGAKFTLQFSERAALVRTNLGAPKGRVLGVKIQDLLLPIKQWPEIVPEREHALLGLSVTKSRLVLEYLVNACSEAQVTDHLGTPLFRLPLPPCSTLAGVAANRFEEEFFFGVESFSFPKISYRFNPSSDSIEEARRTENPIDPDLYETRQEWATSADGTRVPYFIFRRKSLPDGPLPTILYGYGGFGSVETPSFRRGFVPWVERGGVFAVANIRGGGEFGEPWHRGGIGENKVRSFEDFIAVAESLTKSGTTDSRRLGILGGSNGGLLVCAALTMRPSLFGAACARVPLTDMVRFPNFGIAARWVHEYGDPSREADLERILTWSPYHNVKEGVGYPPVLIMTGENDTRVAPMHARKMAAALQWANPQGSSLLVVERDSGHGAGKPVTKVVEAQSLVLKFFARELALPREQKP